MEQLVSLDWRMCPTLRHKAGPKISFQILSEKQKLLPYQVETNEKSPNSYCTVCKHQNPICQLSHNPQHTAVFHRSNFPWAQHQQTRESCSRWSAESDLVAAFATNLQKVAEQLQLANPHHKIWKASWAVQLLFLQKDTGSISQSKTLLCHSAFPEHSTKLGWAR